MDNIRDTIEILIKTINPQEILIKLKKNDKIGKYYYNNPKGNDFATAFTNRIGIDYNKDTVSNIFDLMKDKWMTDERIDEKTIFNIILSFSRNVLIEKKGDPICKYENLLRWRELAHQLGEDLFTTSYLAYNDLCKGNERNNYLWKPVIATDNLRIREILSSGMAENHFHLNGSSLNFQLSWIAVMNEFYNPNIKKGFKLLEETQKLDLNKDITFNGEKRLELRGLIYKAALIRLYLYKEIIKKEKLDLVDINKMLYSESLVELEMHINNLKNSLDVCKYIDGKKIEGEVLDYLINKNSLIDENLNVILSGERRFLYEVFKWIYRNGSIEKNSKLKELFYAYLIIKEEFRKEIIQVNKISGFANFSEYQDRKTWFLDDTKYEKFVAIIAIKGTLSNQSIRSLEVRIAPKETSSKLEKTILRNRKNLITKEEQVKEIFNEIKVKSELEKKYFYNLHFIKQKEVLEKEEFKLTCRNSKLRKQIKIQSIVIGNYRKKETYDINKILGIDAASSEIGCRPEVFGQCFRYLKDLQQNSWIKNKGLLKVIPLGVTYHVGEDFLDIIDGLRAIDEAIYFLALRQGDRLGHALALGICPEQYYKKYRHTVVLSKQNVIDNIAWILLKIKEYDIEVKSNFILKLEEMFTKYYGEVYDGDEYSGACYITYCESLKLRGDNPQLYIIEEEPKINKISSDFERHGLSLSPETLRARKNKKARNLYIGYHYNYNVRKKGEKKVEVKIIREYIELVKEIQKKMQIEVAKKNIFIETNPSSNYLIGTFDKYCEHPIVKFNNLGLTYNPELLKNNPQIVVSINTDDQGVFATSLENEYALMAIALEKELDSDGNPKYNQAMIYDWLDRVRRMGLEQVFERGEE